MEPRRIHEVVHELRGKPVHVRENITLGISGGVTALVLVGWLVVNTMQGTFSLSSYHVASGASTDITPALSSSASNVTNLLGAAGAAFGATSTPASVTVVDTEVHSTLDEQTTASATVIHF